jgi:dethiobiotin synthetase/adenosylmethionine--8-amino-7-oxononanoate aminotransferase
MDLPSRGENPAYTKHIEGILTELVEKKGHKFGALVMEPLLLGAGGMLFV